MSFVDRVKRGTDGIVEAIAPQWAARRAAARWALDRAAKLRDQFQGAETGRRSWSNRTLGSGSADADLSQDALSTLRARSRDLHRNNPIAHTVINSLVDNVVGFGFRPKLRLDTKMLGITDERAQVLAEQADAIWEEWAPHADSTNRMTIEDMQSLIMSQKLVNGDVFVQPLMIQDKRLSTRFDLKLEIIESDRCDTPLGMVNERVRSGIELGKRGQPIGYWISLAHPGDELISGASVRGTRKFRRIPAHNTSGRPGMLHVYEMDRPGQSRGRPALSPILNVLKDRDDYKEAEIMAAQVGACFAAFITKTDPFGAAFTRATTDTQSDPLKREEELSPGAMYYLNPGESVDFGDPSRPSGQFDAFLRSVTREITSTMGMPYEVATRDFSGTTYSQARAALLEARRMFTRRQRWLVRSFLQPVWTMLLEEAWLKGLFEADDFAENILAWTRTHWQPPGWGWIDPQKEVTAWEKALGMGVTTRQAIISSHTGDDFEDITKQLAEEQAIRERLGVGVAPAMVPGGEDDEDDDEDDDDAEETKKDDDDEEETEEAEETEEVEAQ